MQTIASRIRVGSLLLLAMAATAPVALAQGQVTFGGGASTDTGASATGAASAAPPAAPAAPPPASPSELEPAPPGVAGAGAAASEEDEEWAERDRLINEPDALSGGTGLLRTQHAQSGAPGQFRLSFTTEWFSAGFLCSTSFPCQNPRGGAPITSDTTNHIGATISVGATVAKLGGGGLEVYASTMGYANSDDANRPSLLQVLGDSALGIKYGGPLSKVFHLGAMAELWLVNGTGSVGLDGSGTSAKFGPIFTMDLRGTEAHTPLRFSLNTIYSLDNTADVLVSTEQQRGTPVTRIERFGLGVNRVDHFDIHVGGEFFAAEERVRPFIEYNILLPNNRQNYACQPNNPSGDHCLANDTVAPQTITLGGRFYPWKRGFSLLAALDIGVAGTSDFIEEVQPTPPWTLYLGAGWAVDTWERPPVIREKLVEKPVAQAPPRSHVRGTVHEATQKTPVANAIVAYVTRTDLTSMATNADGKFVTTELDPGDYKFAVSADGYKPGECVATIPKPGVGPDGKPETAKDVDTDCPLEALPRNGNVVGHVRDAVTNAPVGGVQMKLTDAANREIPVTADPQGGFRFDNVSPGTAQLSVQAEGYLAAAQPIDVKPRQDNSTDVALQPKPKVSNVVVTKQEVVIRQQIQFAVDSAVILPESFGILSEVADTLIRNPGIHRVEIQGHTDNTGTPDHNKTLSEQRAEAVRLWLTQHGVQPDRLIAKGYGQERPLVPNVTAGNRARNRRVQFIITDREGQAPAAPSAPTTPPKGIQLPPGF
jgi:OmpA-OmpF porin, OOP family